MMPCMPSERPFAEGIVPRPTSAQNVAAHARGDAVPVEGGLAQQRPNSRAAPSPTTDGGGSRQA